MLPTVHGEPIMMMKVILVPMVHEVPTVHEVPMVPWWHTMFVYMADLSEGIQCTCLLLGHLHH